MATEPNRPGESLGIAKGWLRVPMENIVELLNLIDPPPVEIDGMMHVFQNPQAALVLEMLSAAVRRMLDASTILQAPAEGTPPLFDGMVQIPCAVMMNQESQQNGWLFIPHADGQWVSAAKLDSFSGKIIEYWLKERASIHQGVGASEPGTGPSIETSEADARPFDGGIPL